MIKKQPITIYAEMTPNPLTMKFVANIDLAGNEHLEFNAPDETKNSPLARVLFTFPFVKRVFISNNFLSISIHENLDWDDFVLEMREYLTNYLQAGQPVLDEKTASRQNPVVSDVTPEKLPKISDDSNIHIETKIRFILKEYVQPAVASDGGGVEFIDYSNGTLHLRLTGACNGCPSSFQTLQFGIKNIFSKVLPEVKDIKAV